MVVGWTGDRGAVGLKLAWQKCAVCEAKQILHTAFSSQVIMKEISLNTTSATCLSCSPYTTCFCCSFSWQPLTLLQALAMRSRHTSYLPFLAALAALYLTLVTE